MALEIERKFLVTGDDWKKTPGVYICQGYLSRDKNCTVRVRIGGDRAYITIKGMSKGATRQEFEYEIPVEDARQLMKLCDASLVEKVRHEVVFSGFTWEVDAFLGANEGLVVAEIEVESEDQAFDRPEWVGREVTGDARYYNANLATDPYKNWAR